jgi:glutamate/tyrosine decarboxylase-like PLP-dependent enzyme
MLDDMFDYLEHARDRPVWQPIPDATRMAARQPSPTAGTELDWVYDSFRQNVLPYATGNTHPGFMGWVHGAGTAPGMLAELLAAGLNANLGGRDHMPIEIEHQIADWAREWFGFPETSSGIFVTGSSMANLMAVLIARRHALGPDVRARGLAESREKLVAYASRAAHNCIPRAMDFSGIGSGHLRLLPTDRQHGVDCGALESAIAADRAAGLTPFLVVGTAGSVDTGAIDDLGRLAELCAAQHLWFHVDGAFGALAIWSSALAHRLHGISSADSIAFDFHKWGQVPYDAGFLLVRDAALHHDTFASPATYLRQEKRGLAANSPWPCDFGPDLSRGFRALKTWVTLNTFGTERLGRVIERCCALASELERRVRAEPRLELLAPVSLNIVCFRYRCDYADRVNSEIVADLHEGGRVAPSTTTIEGKLAIRACFINHRTNASDVIALVEAVLERGLARSGS